ncbi:MAG: SUMF1/EgtB/PvdO family nonheme iron enzyme [Magnetococcales bacterium]|nr:SUMF1/EgtB/PvdO family nonheme iron enzyme [Magnetococcales bacterium]
MHVSKYFILLFYLLSTNALATEAPIWREERTGMAFARIPGGCFRMGSEEPALAARPVHRVCLKPYWIGRHEVTNAEYGRCVAEGGCPAPEQRNTTPNDHFRTGNDDRYESMGASLGAGDHPQVGVSWVDAQRFGEWLSGKSGHRFRLPTEAEWEYACRGGVAEEIGASGEVSGEFAWYSANSGGTTHAVGKKHPNGYGVYDMSGNAWEWVADHFDARAYESHTEQAPLFVKDDLFHVSRGGSWSSSAIHLHCAFRGVGEERDRDDNLGFRLIREERAP